MIAQRLIDDARAAGFSIKVEDGDIFVDADRDPPPELIANLRQHKAELLAILVPQAGDAPPPRVDAYDLEERAALIEYGAGVPRRWAEGFSALCSMPPPVGFAPERWRRIIDATGTFIDRWAARASEHGWSILDVFGADPDRPDVRFDCMGLVLLLDRHEIVGIDEHGADLGTVTGARQRYRRRPLPAATVALWDLAKRERR